MPDFGTRSTTRRISEPQMERTGARPSAWKTAAYIKRGDITKRKCFLFSRQGTLHDLSPITPNTPIYFSILYVAHTCSKCQ